MLLRFIIYGPLTSILVGLAQTLAAVGVWLAHGQPDFYFRGGLAGIEFHLTVTIIGGGFLGLFFGFLLELFEFFTERQIRIAMFLPLLLAASFAVSLAIVTVEFRHGALFVFPLAAEVFAVLFGLLLAPLVSRPDPLAPQLEPR